MECPSTSSLKEPENKNKGGKRRENSELLSNGIRVSAHCDMMFSMYILYSTYRQFC